MFRNKASQISVLALLIIGILGFCQAQIYSPQWNFDVQPSSEEYSLGVFEISGYRWSITPDLMYDGPTGGQQIVKIWLERATMEEGSAGASDVFDPVDYQEFDLGNPQSDDSDHTAVTLMCYARQLGNYPVIVAPPGRYRIVISPGNCYGSIFVQDDLNWVPPSDW